MMMNNSVGWFLYGLLTRNYWIIFPNIVGISLGLYYTLIGMRFATRKQSTYILLLLYGGLLLSIIGATISFVSLAATIPSGEKGPAQPQILLLGSIAVINLTCFYMSPLSTLYRVISTRNSISFSWRLSLSCFINGVMWTVYGSFIGDLFIAIPNGAGVILAGLQLICIWIFPRSDDIKSIFSRSQHDSDPEIVAA